MKIEAESPKDSVSSISDGGHDKVVEKNTSVRTMYSFMSILLDSWECYCNESNP